MVNLHIFDHIQTPGPNLEQTWLQQDLSHYFYISSPEHSKPDMKICRESIYSLLGLFGKGRGAFHEKVYRSNWSNLRFWIWDQEPTAVQKIPAWTSGLLAWRWKIMCAICKLWCSCCQSHCHGGWLRMKRTFKELKVSGQVVIQLLQFSRWCISVPILIASSYSFVELLTTLSRHLAD